jgi:hypothetical protein
LLLTTLHLDTVDGPEPPAGASPVTAAGPFGCYLRGFSKAGGFQSGITDLSQNWFTAILLPSMLR